MKRSLLIPGERSATHDAPLAVGTSVAVADEGRYRFDLLIERFDQDQVDWVARKLGDLRQPTREDFARWNLQSYRTDELTKNLLTTAGLGRLATLFNAGTGNLIATNTVRVGVGNGAGTAVIGDTDLSAAAGSTNRWFNLCVVTIPSNVLTAVASFASGDGNFAWNEFGLDIGTATVTAAATVNAVLLNHKTSIAQGTKASGQIWTATATITIS